MSHDTWLHRFVRLGVRPLVDTPVTPNHLTSLRLAFGLGGTAALAVGEGNWPAFGAGAFLVSMLLDRADGELARLSGKTSPFGHKLDLVTDGLCNTLIFVGLGVGLMSGQLGGWAALLGVLAGVAVAAMLGLVIRLEALGGERAGEISGGAGFDPDDAMIAVPLAIWLGWREPLLIAAAVGAPLFAIGMFVKFRGALRRDSSPGSA